MSFKSWYSSSTILKLTEPVTRPQQLTIDIEQVLGWATAARHDEMGMGGHTVTPISMIRLHYHLGVKFVFRIVGDIIVKANTVEQFLVLNSWIMVNL